MRCSNLVPVAMLVTLAACSGAGTEEDTETSLDALTSEGTPDTTLTRMFLQPAKTSFERGRPGPVRYLVIHDIEGSASSAVNTFRARGALASAHYIVDKAGAIIQMVHEGDIANHAGHAAFNAYAIGIEHAGHARQNEYTDAEYRASARLAADVAARHGIPIDKDHIVGHSQVPRTDPVLVPCSRTSTTCGGRSAHDDPGPHWDWTKYMPLVEAAARAIGYSGVGGPDPNLASASTAALATDRTLPGAYWITQCTAEGAMQTAFRTIDGVSRAESRYVQRAAGPCGEPANGSFPLVFHGLAQADVHALTVHACEHGTTRTYATSGDVPCGGGTTCAVASLVDGTAAACP
jgi:N-acetyl-anhydromuramyl-L-alanine amidase AmpD